mmetsp:Transcript_47222/g.131853  ORF Transcript_47222/g.131853 Transcript_47222/m.131853 type:complete len:236 (+) Transcript_47222:984-1691(+)
MRGLRFALSLSREVRQTLRFHFFFDFQLAYAGRVHCLRRAAMLLRVNAERLVRNLVGVVGGFLRLLRLRPRLLRLGVGVLLHGIESHLDPLYAVRPTVAVGIVRAVRAQPVQNLHAPRQLGQLLDNETLVCLDGRQRLRDVGNRSPVLRIREETILALSLLADVAAHDGRRVRVVRVLVSRLRQRRHSDRLCSHCVQAALARCMGPVRGVRSWMRRFSFVQQPWNTSYKELPSRA